MRKNLYIQVLFAIVLGIFVGSVFPSVGIACKPLGDGFIKLIKMLIAPLVFCTVTTGIASMQNMHKLGRTGIKVMVYFEIISTLALLIGWIVVHLIEPGKGMDINVAQLDTSAISTYTQTAQHHGGMADFLLNIIPSNVLDAFSKGDLLQVLLFSVLFGASLAKMGKTASEVLIVINKVSEALFGIVETIMKLAPIGAFGAMAFTISQYGIQSLLPLVKLMACFYLTCFLFITLILGSIARYTGFSLWKLLVYIRDELLIVLGTSSSESALPRIMQKLQNLGCSNSMVSLVIPTGYSFNLDGTAIYLVMAAVFLAEATNTPLDIGQEMGLLGILMITSKGAAGVTGSGFVTLAATLSVSQTIPVASLALILGIDRFMSEARAITNLVGNSVATIVTAHWEGELDQDQLDKTLNG